MKEARTDFVVLNNVFFLRGSSEPIGMGKTPEAVSQLSVLLLAAASDNVLVQQLDKERI